MTAELRLTEVSVDLASLAELRLTEVSIDTGTVAELRLTEVSIDVALSGSAPLVVASHDQEVSSGADVLVSCSALSAAGSTIVSYGWRVVSKPVGSPGLTFSSPAVQSPTFIAPCTIGGLVYVLGVTVTDSAGRASSESVTTITVDPADFLYPNPVTGAWDRTGTDLQPTADGRWA